MVSPALRQVLRATPPLAWSRWDKGPGLFLSNGGLTVTGANAFPTNVSIRANRSHSAGKYCFAFTATFTAGGVPGALSFGIGSAGFDTTTYVGATNYGIAYDTDGNVFRNNGTNLGPQPTYAQGATPIAAVDLDLSLIWYKVGANGWNNGLIGVQNPATGTGGFALSGVGPYFPACTVNANCSATIDFSAQAGAPAGFGKW